MSTSLRFLNGCLPFSSTSCYVRATEQVEDLEEFLLMLILDFKASSCQDCCIKCIVLSEYYPTNNDSQFISKNIHCCVTKFLLSVPKPKNHFSLCVNFKTSPFSTEEPSSLQILSIQHLKYTTHSTPYPSIQNIVFNSLQINPQKSKHTQQNILL